MLCQQFGAFGAAGFIGGGFLLGGAFQCGFLFGGAFGFGFGDYFLRLFAAGFIGAGFGNAFLLGAGAGFGAFLAGFGTFAGGFFTRLLLLQTALLAGFALFFAAQTALFFKAGLAVGIG